MNDVSAIQLIALFGWLILSGSALASYRLGWKASIRMALVWAGIFAAVALAFSLVMG